MLTDTVVKWYANLKLCNIKTSIKSAIMCFLKLEISSNHNLKFQTAVLLLPHGGTTLAGKQRLRHLLSTLVSNCLRSSGIHPCHQLYQSHFHCQSSRGCFLSPLYFSLVQGIFVKSLYQLKF